MEHIPHAKADGNLRQGDVLTVTKDLAELLLQYHPHYIKNLANKHYVVLTQCCDLELRGDKCKTRYITIAPVRHLSHIISTEFPNEITNCEVHVFREDKKSSLRDFLGRLLNNNIHDYFYIHEGHQFQFPTSSCVVLRLQISFRAEHYKKLQEARIFTLTDNFRDKLGWLTGDLYSRVGTADWPDIEKKQIIEKEEGNFVWVNTKKFGPLKQASEKWLGKNPGKKISEEALEEIITGIITDERTIKNKFDEKITDLLTNSKLVKSLIRDGLLVEVELEELIKLIQNDAVIRNYLKLN